MTKEVRDKFFEAILDYDNMPRDNFKERVEAKKIIANDCVEIAKSYAKEREQQMAVKFAEFLHDWYEKDSNYLWRNKDNGWRYSNTELYSSPEFQKYLENK